MKRPHWMKDFGPKFDTRWQAEHAQADATRQRLEGELEFLRLEKSPSLRDYMIAI